jgi:phospholipid N-methyltransferase
MPSSRFLIDRLLRPIDFEGAASIVQLGVGTGCITQAILNRMSRECRLICVEVDEEFVRACASIHDERLTIHHACARDLRNVLGQAGVAQVDHIVSSVPLSILDDDLADEILRAAQECLRPGGKFLQYQYSLTYLKRLTARYGNVSWGFTLRNVPPAFVYECVQRA